MAKTVIQAFDEFLKDKVNLDPGETSKARNSRNWLIDRIHEFDSGYNTFPAFYVEADIYFGSFARRTKKRELDDIDIMIGLSAQGATYYVYGVRVELTVTDTAPTLKSLCHDGTNSINSRKVINKFISNLNKIPQYEKSDIKRNHEAATLKLTSYTWNFDIVPCFMTSPNIYGKTYYLIPDGNGYWKFTDPRIDREKAKVINQKHDGNVLNIIRIMKYWNKRSNMPDIGSYLLESMILNYYDGISNSASKYVDIEIPGILEYIHNNIHYIVNGPKGIDGNINKLSYEERTKVFDRTYYDYYKAIDARRLEGESNYKDSIRKWGEIFGGYFPRYE